MLSAGTMDNPPPLLKQTGDSTKGSPATSHYSTAPTIAIIPTPLDSNAPKTQMTESTSPKNEK